MLWGIRIPLEVAGIKWLVVHRNYREHKVRHMVLKIPYAILVCQTIIKLVIALPKCQATQVSFGSEQRRTLQSLLLIINLRVEKGVFFMSLDKAITAYITYIQDVDRLAPKTVYERGRWLRGFRIWAESENLQLDDMRVIDVKRYFATKTNLSRNSLGALMVVMRAFFKYLQEEEEAPLRFSWNKIKPITPERVQKIVIPQEVVYRVLREIDDEQLKIIIYLAFGSGFRVSEIAKLRVENLYDCYASVVKGKGRAGGKDRECRIHPEIMNYLHHYLKRKNITSGYIVRRKQVHKNVDQDSPVDTDTIARWIKEVFAPHGYNAPPHIARYSFATNMYLNGADIVTVQVSLGHENVSTTQRYLKVPPKYIQESFDRHMTLRPIS